MVTKEPTSRKVNDLEPGNGKIIHFGSFQNKKNERHFKNRGEKWYTPTEIWRMEDVQKWNPKNDAVFLSEKHWNYEPDDDDF